MIGKVCKRGSDARRLLGYLFREGLAGEHGLTAAHTAPRLIAAWDGADGLEPRSSLHRVLGREPLRYETATGPSGLEAA